MNAYLDGELDGRGAGSGERGAQTIEEIEVHLESCADCQALLEEVKRVRDRAGEILASSTPADLAAPSFDEIRARAEARATGSRALQLARIKHLAWAATVILAVAVGWYARGTVFPRATEQMGAPQPTTIASEEQRVAESEGQEVENRDQGAGSVEQGAGSGERGVEGRIREAEERVPPVVAAELDRTVAAADRDAAGRGADVEKGVPAVTPATEVVAPAPSQAKAEPNAELKADELANLAEVREDRMDTVSQLAAEAPRPVTQLVTGQGPVRVGGVELDELLLYEDSLWVHASEAQAREALGGDVPIVGDLPVVDYWVAGSRWSKAVRVRQRLDDANHLELIVSRPIDNVRSGLTARRIAAPVSAQRTQATTPLSFETVAVRSGDYLVILRGPVSPDSLQALAEKIK